MVVKLFVGGFESQMSMEFHFDFQIKLRASRIVRRNKWMGCCEVSAGGKRGSKFYLTVLSERTPPTSEGPHFKRAK